MESGNVLKFVQSLILVFSSHACCSPSSVIMSSTPHLPVEMFVDMLNNIYPSHPVSFMQTLLEVSFEQGPEYCRAVLELLDMEYKLPRWWSWSDEAVKGKLELIQLGRNVGCKAVMFYNACSEICGNDKVETNLLTLNILSGDRLLFRFCYHVLSAVFDPKVSHRMDALRGLEEIAVDPLIPRAEIGDMITYLATILHGNEILRPGVMWNQFRWDCVARFCPNWDTDTTIVHGNPYTQRSAENLDEIQCPKCKVKTMLEAFYHHERPLI